MKNITNNSDNCLSSCLRQWRRDPSLVLYYNSNHVIALMKEDKAPEGYLTLDNFGEEYFLGSFGTMLDTTDRITLNEYMWEATMMPEKGPITAETVASHLIDNLINSV